MLELTSVLAPDDSAPVRGVLTLPYDQRRKARLRAPLDDGSEAALLLPRGIALKDGDRLRSKDGSAVVRVRAAAELLSIAATDDALLLSRAAYHLGNRHVPLQIRPGRLAYQHDHVLDGLARELGLHVTTSREPFEPEAGGYGGGRGHAHEPHAHGQGRHHDDHHHHGDHHHHDEQPENGAPRR